MKKVLLSAMVLAGTLATQAQDTLRNKPDGGYLFTVQNEIEATSVKNQYRSGTCWSYSALSFFESELIRMGKEPVDLSEMFIVYKTYSDKAVKYVRMNGKLNFGAGGAFHDAQYVIANYGIVPNSAYFGLNYGTELPVQAELDDVALAYVDVIVSNPNKTLSTAWHNGFEGVLDAYLGEIPATFEVDGKEYTAESYRDDLGLNMDDYISFTSFTHHPFYSSFALEVPDNWMNAEMYNVPLEDLMAIMFNAVENGYGIAWAADVSEKGFNFRSGLAIVPSDMDNIKKKGKDNKNFSDAGAEKTGNQFDTPGEELVITQELRQTAFDNYETTDDHGMHITGWVKDQDGTPYFIVKNSWGTSYNKGKAGYFFASQAYVMYKTMDIMVHKDAVPKEIKKKLGIK